MGLAVVFFTIALAVLMISYNAQHHTPQQLAFMASVMLYPLTIPFYVLLVLLVVTVDNFYFPTGGVILGYAILMFAFGHFPRPDLAFLVSAFFAWIFIGAIWMYVKWWSYLRDPSNTTQVRAVPDGQERAFFISRIPYLYPHFLYWPISIPHTILTRLVYQIFEWVALRFGNSFGQMVANRKAELQ